MMKKFFALALSAVMMLSLLAGCGSKDEPSTTEPEGGAAQEETASDLNVAVFYYDYSDVYISSVRNALDTLFGEMGIKPNNYDGGGNQSMQTDQINTAIANGTNLLIVNIVETSSPDAAQNAVDAAKTAGIPIIFFNREVDNSVVSSYDSAPSSVPTPPEPGHMQGQLIGEYLLEHYDEVDLNKDGSISYVMFKGQKATPRPRPAPSLVLRTPTLS